MSLKLNLYKKAGEHPTTIEDKDVEWVFLTSALNFSFWKDDHDPQYLATFTALLFSLVSVTLDFPAPPISAAQHPRTWVDMQRWEPLPPFIHAQIEPD